ncbi:MAG TPA: DNA primase [Candidatus Sulfomarinibacteraceae bacterium]|nr:DNA primase [Candidatus Sulfomarinibacteraceae bacterium]
MSVTDEIKNRLDIVDVVSETVQLRRSGRNYTGFCPFHQNTRTPAFVVFPETQTWRCFGACAEGGDIFSYVMKREGWDFKEALRVLAQRAGVQLEELSPAAKARRAEEDRLTTLLQAAADYFHQLLLHAPQAEHARRYVTQRALEDETLDTFRIGYALDSWDACRTHFNGQGYDDDDLVQAGLLSENLEKGTRYDRFRNRLMFPIRDAQGRVVGFGARTLEKDGIPKYLNSPQTGLFDKSNLLYGLDMARRHIREARQAVIVEGYMDVLQGWQAGFRNMVAQMGTALTETQLRLLKRYTKRFVIALDADAAGVQATMRSLEVAREALDRDMEVRFDARGLVQHEGRLKADIRIVTLPEGQDPDDIIRKDASQWPQLLAGAKPVVAYVIDVVTDGLDLNDAKAKADAVRQVMPLIGDVADPVERDHYRQTLSRVLRVDERALQQVALASSMSAMSRSREGRPAARPAPPPAAGREGNGASRADAAVSGGKLATTMRESDYLRQCLRRPQLMRLVDQRLRAQDQAIVREDDFAAAEDKALLRHLRQELGRRPVVTVEELCDSLDEVLLSRAEELLSETSGKDEIEPERLADSLARLVLDLRLERIRRLLAEVQQLVHEAKEQGSSEQLEVYKEQLQTLPVAVHSIDRAKWAMSAMSRRQAEEASNG